MMYSNKMVCCLKADGKVLREFKDTTYIPFGSEYSILLKNLNSVRASVNITIDGQDVTEGNSLIVNSTSELELTRFIKNGNMNVGNRFKFIERTAQIEEYKGVGIEDGLIRIEFQFEKVYQPINVQPFWNHNPGYNSRDHYLRSSKNIGNSIQEPGFIPCSSENRVTYCASPNTSYGAGMNTQSVTTLASTNEVGITVAGSISTQQFQTVSGFSLEPEKHVMILKLLGETEQGQPITQPITVTTKTHCDTCGTVNKSLAKFCYNCGTSLMGL